MEVFIMEVMRRFAEEYYQTTFSNTFDVPKTFDYFRNLGSGFTEDGKIVWNLAFEPYQNGRG
jgi:hypothetical protein